MVFLFESSSISFFVHVVVRFLRCVFRWRSSFAYPAYERLVCPFQLKTFVFLNSEKFLKILLFLPFLYLFHILFNFLVGGGWPPVLNLWFFFFFWSIKKKNLCLFAVKSFHFCFSLPRTLLFLLQSLLYGNLVLFYAALSVKYCRALSRPFKCSLPCFWSRHCSLWAQLVFYLSWSLWGICSLVFLKHLVIFISSFVLMKEWIHWFIK